ncbi:hypothetical protein [Streptomyces sp. NPDC049040]|uniref:hypothetical protein n=1 Tax=Streptomyces sp. NPDC049040 TaxID=3365593 RepID=UPI0037179FB3
MKARAALLAAAGLLLAGCGIPTTGVVEAGEPAVGVHQDVTLYFVRSEDGELATVQRRIEQTVDADLAVRMLLGGVAAVEQKVMGLTTQLPPMADVPGIRTDDGEVTVDLRVPAERLSRTAVEQVVCTVLTNTVGLDADPASVTVTADGTPMPGPTGSDRCVERAPFYKADKGEPGKRPTATPSAPVRGG